MRSILFPKSLLVPALGSVVVLAAAGTPSAHATTPAPSARTFVIHAPAHASITRTARKATAVTAVREAETRFLELADLIAQACEPNVLSAAGPAPAPDRALPALADPIALTPAEECAAQRHRLRISKAFSGTETATYKQMRDRLTVLRYPGARIHRMPDFSGRPVSRFDLRVGADHLALEVTGIGNGVMIRAFGAPQGVSVTEVRLNRQPDRPTS
ncbi:hypothetical protein ACN6LM_006727 [Streptomyces sp. SAS_281]|uniref:hypothetical protein n=1 Tax=Streptomyces sp. SAS_281 TaxID=3412744 RepID=UPI00403C6D70